MKDNIFDDSIAKERIKFNAYKNVREAIKQYGLEGTEDKIKEIYQKQPRIKELLLKTLYEIWKG
jgi:predicted component of type VI protein secretion system